MTAIACTPSDPLECVAVGLNGLIVRGDGTNWNVQPLPGSAPAGTDITGVAFDGRTPLLATTDGLYRGTDRPASTSATTSCATGCAGRPARAAVTRVATVDGGGVVVDGRFARDAATAPWRPPARRWTCIRSRSPPIRDGASVRTIVSADAGG